MATTTCHWHPDRETGLRCSSCGKPICVECMRQHPVGIRCKECAKAMQLPMFQVSKAYVARGVGAAIGLGIGGLVVLGLLHFAIGSVLGFFGIFLMMGLGYVIGEGVSVAVNRRRGRPYQYMAVGGVVIATLPELTFALFTLSLGAAFTLVGVAIAASVAWHHLEP
jgi:hypothetical protein